MGVTIGDMDKELEIKDNNLCFLKNKVSLTDSKLIREMSKLGFEKYHLKEKVIGL